jgi:thiamine-monophosphate kinase
MVENSQTKIETIGEFGLINRISEILKGRDSKIKKGIGDDSAVIEIDDQRSLLVSTDSLVEGVHFDLSYMPLRHLGYKAVVVSISDIAAMNGIPKYLTVAIGLSSKFSVEAVEEFYQGIDRACENYGIEVVGGDTTASQKGMFINMTALGFTDNRKISYRSGSQPEDVICVSGDLGGAYIGMHVLEREKVEFQANPQMQPALDDFSYVVGKQLRPEARTDLVKSMDELGIHPSSQIDISDGLASELMHLSKESRNEFKIYEDKIPIAEETRKACMDFNLDPTVAVLNGGEDYELLFTLGLKDFEKVKNHPDITAIGYVQKGEGAKLVKRTGTIEDIKAQGWDHFKD